MDKLKVVVLSTNADASGAPNHVLSLVSELHQKVQFFVIFGEDGPAIDKLAKLGVPTKIVPEMRSRISLRADLKAFTKIRRLIQTFAPSVVHCHSTKAGMLGRIAAASLGIPSLYTVHGWGWRGLNPIARILVYTIELALRFTPNSSYIFVSKSVEHEAQRLLLIKSAAGVTIYNGLPDIPTSPEPETTPLKILMPARVAKAKDHETLVRAFELLDVDAELVLCGSDTDGAEFRSNLAQWAPSKMKRIATLGQRLDVVDLLNQTNIFALVSNFEALPISIIEAMRANRAIIATDVGGISELIQNDRSGILVKPKDIQAVYSAIKKMADAAIRKNMTHAARRSFVANFRAAEMASSVLKLYLKAAKPSVPKSGSNV